MCDHGGECTHESSEVITGAVLTNSVNDLFRHFIAVKEPRNGRLAKAEVKVACGDVAACRIKRGQVPSIVTLAQHHVLPEATCTSKSRGAQTSAVLFFT